MFSCLRFNQRLSPLKVSALKSQLQYLIDHPEISPNQLKWKQFVNLLIGSRRSEAQLVSLMEMTDLIPIVSFFRQIPSQLRRHEVLTSSASRLLELRQRGGRWPTSDCVRVIRGILEASLDVIDQETKRFKSQQIQASMRTCHDLINRLVEDILKEAHEVTTSTVTTDLLFALALGLRKGWLTSVPDQAVIESIAVLTLAQLDADASLRARAETVWALGELSSVGGYLISDSVKAKVKRLLGESELLPFDLTQNFSTVDSVPREDFSILLQLQSGFEHLGLSDTCISSRVAGILSHVSTKPEFADSSICVYFIWWLAQSESPVHPLLNEWAKTCINRADSLTDNERWMASTGLAHVMEIARRRDDDLIKILSETEISQLQYCVRKDVLNRPKRASVSWRKGDHRHFI